MFPDGFEPSVLLALETGARYNTIRTLRWSNIDFANRCQETGYPQFSPQSEGEQKMRPM